MASGKSTLGKILAKKLKYKFVDLDELIEENEKISVSQVFKDKGEVYFRKKEALYLKELLEGTDNLVLSVGGGTPCYGLNMRDIINTPNVRSIYLKASITTLVKKLMKKKSERPLIAHIRTKEAMQEFIGKHLFERIKFYDQAEIIINIDNKTKTEVIKEILPKLV